MTGVAVGVPHHEGVATTSSRPAVRVYQDSARSGVTTPGTTGAGTMDDMDIAVRMRNEIQHDPALRSAMKAVDIEVKNGQMILRGNVASEHQRALLHQRLDSYPGITSTDDRLTIGRP